MKFEMYRRLDLFIFFILMMFSSISSLFIFSNKSFQFYFSFTTLILFITLIRWKYLGILPYLLCQIIFSLIQIYFFHTEIAYTLAANMGCILFLFVIPLIASKIKGEIRRRPFFLILLLLVTYICVGLGIAISLVFVNDYNILGNFIFYIFNQEIYSIVISIVLVLLLRTIDNLIVNVKEHLRMIQEKEENEAWRVLENDKKLK